MLAFQEATESSLTVMCKDSNLSVIHGKRVTIMPKDIQLIYCISGEKTLQFGNEKKQDETKQLLSHRHSELDLIPPLEEQFSHDSNNANENVSHTKKKHLIKAIPPALP